MTFLVYFRALLGHARGILIVQITCMLDCRFDLQLYKFSFSAKCVVFEFQLFVMGYVICTLFKFVVTLELPFCRMVCSWYLTCVVLFIRLKPCLDWMNDQYIQYILMNIIILVILKMCLSFLPLLLLAPVCGTSMAAWKGWSK